MILKPVCMVHETLVQGYHYRIVGLYFFLNYRFVLRNVFVGLVSLIVCTKQFQVSFCRNSRSEQEIVVETITEEIIMMTKLNHPNVVRIMGATRHGCHFNMFVEWMPGRNFAIVFKPNKNMSCLLKRII